MQAVEDKMSIKYEKLIKEEKEAILVGKEVESVPFELSEAE